MASGHLPLVLFTHAHTHMHARTTVTLVCGSLEKAMDLALACLLGLHLYTCSSLDHKLRGLNIAMVYHGGLVLSSQLN